MSQNEPQSRCLPTVKQLGEKYFFKKMKEKMKVCTESKKTALGGIKTREVTYVTKNKRAFFSPPGTQCTISVRTHSIVK